MTTVFDAPELVLHERGRVFSDRHEYGVLTPDGELLAVVEEDVRYGFLGTLASSRYTVSSAGRLLLTVERPGFWGRMEFHGVRPDGVPFGRVQQENTWGAPRLELATLDGVLARMTGGEWGSREWSVTLHADPRPTSLLTAGDVIAGVQRRPRSFDRFLVDADEFVLRTGPSVDPELRALLLVGVIALDGVRDQQKKARG